MRDIDAFAAMMTHAQHANVATTETERREHIREAQALARELLSMVGGTADMLVVSAARAGLGQLANMQRAAGLDPIAIAEATELEMFLTDDTPTDTP